MSLIKCPYCDSHVVPDRLSAHLVSVHSGLELDADEIRDIATNRQNPQELGKHFPAKSKQSTKKNKKKKSKQAKNSSAKSKTTQASRRKTKTKPILLTKVKVKYTKDSSASPSKTSTPQTTNRKKPNWTPILSSKNKYPIGNCRKCGEEVYFVPIEQKNGRRGEKKYDMSPFAPHQCDEYMRDPLDDPRTIRIFRPKDNPYRY